MCPAKMMDELSVTMCYDAHSMEQMSEEEILACLVAETGPTFTVPTKKAKIKESRLQLMEDKEDPLDKFLRENRRLQQASHRLEQENDNLAQKLISSKVALRKALDKAEDRVDELSEELLQARHRVQATEEEKREKEEETAMLKEVLRRELEKAEQEVKRSTGIISDYKQICSQLTDRLERQQVTHAEELEALKGAMRLCSQCQLVADPDEAPAEAEDSPSTGKGAMESSHSESVLEKSPPWKSSEPENESLKTQITELEQELAQTKLQMVEAKCKIQELEHQKGILASDLQQAKNNWISKAFTSLRTSSGAGGGGLHGVSIPTQGGALSGWRVKKLSWPHRESRGNV